MDLKLNEKVALVTGAGQGLGRAIGLAFAKEGGRVAFHYRSSAEGAAAGAAESHALGVETMVVGADLRSDEAVADAVERVESELGAAGGRDGDRHALRDPCRGRPDGDADRGAPRALLEPYLAHLRLTFPIVLDPDVKTAGAWRVAGLPATFIVKPGGEVAGMAAGAREWNSAEMRSLLETLLPVAQVSAVSRTGLRPALALTGPGRSSTLGPAVTHADSHPHR